MRRGFLASQAGGAYSLASSQFRKYSNCSGVWNQCSPPGCSVRSQPNLAANSAAARSGYVSMT